MNYFITGGAGFIGSHFVDYLVKKNNKVIVYDNLILGKIDNISQHLKNKKIKFIKANTSDLKKLTKSMKNSHAVIHLSANSDIVKSAIKPIIEIKDGIMGTFNVLQAMKINKINKIIFTSSSVVYGEATKMPTKENYGPLFPISFYGSSKLASEALISAFCHNYGIKGWIFRFANVVGSRTTHGVIYDFYNKVKKNNNELNVLGDGNQTKPYIHVNDIVKGVIFCFKKSNKNLNFFNLSTIGQTKLKTIIKFFLKEMNLQKTKIIFGRDKRGWLGDVIKVKLDNSKIKKLGYKFLKPNSDDAFILGLKDSLRWLKKYKS
jgi:UDP-glucose 4-epimerase